MQSASGPIRKVGRGGACRTMIYILVCARDSAWGMEQGGGGGGGGGAAIGPRGRHFV